MPFDQKNPQDLSILLSTLSDLELVHKYRGTINPVLLEMSNRLVNNYYAMQALLYEAENNDGFRRRINELENKLDKETIDHAATNKELEFYRRVYG